MSMLIKDPSSYRNLDACTAHITKQDSKLLDNRDCPLAVHNTDYGWLVYCGSDSDKNVRDGLKWFGFSLAFIELFMYARREGYKWLDLDCDGWVYEELPKFEWEKQ